MELKDLVEQFNTVNTELKNAREAQEKAIKQAQDGSAEAKSQVEAMEQKFNDMQQKHDEALKKLTSEFKRVKEAAPVEQKTMGQTFIESFNDDFNEKSVLARRGVEVKDITGVGASAGALARPDRDPTVYRSIGGMRQLRIADLLPAIPTSSNAVEVMRLADAGDPAEMQGTAAGIGAGELQPKAKATLEWELVTVSIPTVAVHTIASRQVLSDAPMLRSLIDGELTYKLHLKSDEQLLNGDGTGQNLTGIMQDSSINDVGEIASGTTADDLPGAMIDHIRAAVTECQKNEYYNINGLVLNPVDWQTLETAKATDGHYLLVAFAATSGEAQTVWRVPVIVTNAMAEGEFLLGDWQLGAQLYVREGVSIRASEHHKELFTENGVAILCETRYALGVSRPKAFTKGSFAVAA
ncbi:putative major capsid protein [Idiomarinaceae phage 1N2-2]|uniref:putative major capsid protein n=1 Tax=Idiomarinaceae phage 1N2-2 TaxID=1536592 RepID=UPI0004F8B066|nr:putative major capsid protein [Idiomarinaceae phage 1N2-2]AIM40712.1 putative major capsid protein [Idiomarinaceae phage 1N2-2]